MRPIDADALCEGLSKDFGYRFPLYDGTRLGATQLLVTREDVMTFISHFAPTIEAEPVRHGRWIKCDMGIGYLPLYQCSICGKHWNVDMDFCGECGAKMDLINKEHEHEL